MVKAGIFDFDFGSLSILIYVISLSVWYYSTYYNNKEGMDYDDIVKERQDGLGSALDTVLERGRNNGE